MSVTATRLGFAAAQSPPPQMRERVLAGAARTRQLPPVVDHAARPGNLGSGWPRAASEGEAAPLCGQCSGSPGAWSLRAWWSSLC